MNVYSLTIMILYINKFIHSCDMQLYINIFSTRTLFLATAVFALVENSCKPLAYSKGTEKELDIGERFHHETSLTWLGVVGDLFRGKPEKPTQYKSYPDTKTVKLPRPAYQGMSLEKAIGKRRSVRNYSGKPLTLPGMSRLLFSAQGITGKLYDQPLRTAN